MRYVLFLAGLAVVAAVTPSALKRQSTPEGEAARQTSQPSAYSVSAAPKPKPTTVSAPAGRKVRIEADRSGHYRTELKFNGRRIEGLIDTGATVVAINKSTARKIGLPVASLDFRYEVSTANGKAKAAAAIIETIDIGRIHLDNVEAMVLDDRALGGTLIGMSVLKRLSRYQVVDQVLLLEQ